MYIKIHDNYDVSSLSSCDVVTIFEFSMVEVNTKKNTFYVAYDISGEVTERVTSICLIKQKVFQPSKRLKTSAENVVKGVEV